MKQLQLIENFFIYFILYVDTIIFIYIWNCKKKLQFPKLIKIFNIIILNLRNYNSKIFQNYCVSIKWYITYIIVINNRIIIEQ